MMTEDQRDAARDHIANILEDVAKNGMPHPRDLDVALDAIFCTFEDGLKEAEAGWIPADRAPHGETVEVRFAGPIHARLVGWEFKHWGIYSNGQYVGRTRVQPTHFRKIQEDADVA